MRKLVYFLSLILLNNCTESTLVEQEKRSVEGLKQSVEILRDQWGINHLYAQNQHDLFFTQGYAAAQDRLFQFEIWRRQATGTVAEILGARELKRDIGTRLFKYRGDLDRVLYVETLFHTPRKFRANQWSRQKVRTVQ